MKVSKRFVITKDELNDAITYLEYEKIKGFDVKPKKEVEIVDMINVDKMIIINPSLIEKLVDKKCKKALEHILKMTSIIYNVDVDEDADGNLNMILGEIAKFRDLLEHKSHEYIKESEYKLLLKKLDIIKSEVNLRKTALRIRLEQQSQKKGKGR